MSETFRIDVEISDDEAAAIDRRAFADDFLAVVADELDSQGLPTAGVHIQFVSDDEDGGQ